MNNSQKAKFIFFLGNLTSCIFTHAASKTPPPPAPYYYDANSHVFFTDIDYLLWQPFTVDSTQWVEIPVSSLPQIPVLKYKWNSGLRVEVGYRGAQATPTKANPNKYGHPWQLQASYLHYSTQAPFEKRSNNPPVLLDYFSNATFQYDRIDLAAAWPFWLSQNAIFRILLGASGVDIQNKMQVKSSVINIIATKLDTDSWDFRWKYMAAGLLAGADASLPFGAGFGLFMNLTSLFLTGNMSEKANYTHIQDSNQIKFSDNEKLSLPKTVIDFRAGLDFKHGFPKSCLVYFFIGYEITWMLDIDPVRRELDLGVEHIFTSTPTTMGVQGGTIRLGFEF